MAQSIIFNLARNLITKLGSFPCQELALLRGVPDELDKLKDTVSAIEAVILDAEEQQSKSRAVKDWVSKLKYAFYEIDDLFDELSYEILRRQIMTRDRRKTKQVRLFFSKPNQIAFTLKMARNIKKIRERLEAINAGKTQFHFAEQMICVRGDGLRKAREAGSYIPEEEVVGRDDAKIAVIDLLLKPTTKEDVAVISIVGMGGLGKTALAQYVYNDNMMVKHFELKLWVCVSDEFDVKLIIEKIIESATGEKPESFHEIDTLQHKLKNKIYGKKYLLVMDDVWNENYEKWVTLRRSLMGGAKGSRVLITTRSRQVAETFDTSSLYSLENLDEYSSWLLFKKMTFFTGPEEDDENSNLAKIGKEIVAKLKGVPLAIRTIGRLLYVKRSKVFWSSFKDKELYQIMEQIGLEDMRSILELSYNQLPSSLKRCFLYCALFPKDYEIRKDEVIMQWVAQGFIQPNDKDKLVDIGEDYFMELLSRSFFQNVTKDKFGDIKACKMHDLMHDLACSIVKNECVHGVVNDINKRTHHFSVDSMSWEKLEALSKARNLRTFFALDHAHSLDGIFEQICYNHLRLRALDLRKFESQSEKLFESISKLKHLRYLSIWNTNIKFLPHSITELYNLETFILCHCVELIELPRDIKNLINLKHLRLVSNRHIKFLPNSITELSNLETLILTNCQALKELPREVKNWINLRHLDLSSSDVEFLPDSITHLNNLETLCLRSCYKLKELPGDTKKMINLKHLAMYGCSALTHVPKGLGELTNLQTLNLFVLGKDNGGGLSELNGLNKLRGSLTIRGLQFCSTIDLQRNAKFLKLGLQELVLLGRSDSFDEPPFLDLYCGESDDDKLDNDDYSDDDYSNVEEKRCLESYSNLQKITIQGYKEVTLCSWLSSDSLGFLVHMELVSCPRLQNLPQLDTLPYLKCLYLVNLPSIEYIGNNDYVSSSTFFPSLEKLVLFGMPNLKGWWKGITDGSFIDYVSSSIFPCLSKLNIFGCPLHILIPLHAPNLKSLKIRDLKTYCIKKDEFDVVPWRNFESLSTLMLSSLFNLEHLPKGLQHVTGLQHLILYRCKNLKSLPEWIDNLTSLKQLVIRRCKRLTSLPEGIRHIHS